MRRDRGAYRDPIDCGVWERKHIDPEGKYPADGYRQVEANAVRVLAAMLKMKKAGYPFPPVERTRDAIQIDRTLNKEGIVVLVTAEAVEIRLPSVEWTKGAYGPAGVSLLWRRLETDGLDWRTLPRILDEAHGARDALFKECEYCKRPTPPEHRVEGACHSCAEKHRGIVF